MAQKSKSEKDGNVDFFNRKKWGKISNISNTNTTVVFGENRQQIQVCIPPEEEAIASKASVIHVCRSICLFVCPKQQKTKPIDKYKMKLRIVVFQDISHNFLPHPPIPPENPKNTKNPENPENLKNPKSPKKTRKSPKNPKFQKS